MNKKLAKREYLEILLRSPNTIFTTKDASLLWKDPEERKVAIRLSKYAKAGKLIRIRRGIYAKDKNYDRFELANRIYTPSYISFETVLTRSGINFQFYSNIFVASYVTREIKVGDQKISFVRMKDYVLSNTAGIERSENISIASKERAFLDRIYVTKNYYFDNLNPLDWKKVFEILPVYNNKKMEKRVRQYFEHHKKEENQ